MLQCFQCSQAPLGKRKHVHWRTRYEGSAANPNRSNLEQRLRHVPWRGRQAERVTSLYDLADAAYDAKEIREMSARLGHVPIIDENPRRGEKHDFSQAEAVRYRERSAAERVNSHLHDEHGGRNVRVRGPVKVSAHLAFGLVVIAAEQLLKLIT